MYAEYRGKLIAGKPPKLKQKQELQRKKKLYLLERTVVRKM